MRDLLFSFLSSDGDQHADTLPLVPVVARVVLGVQVRGGASRTYAPFPLGTRVSKLFPQGVFRGVVSAHLDTLDDGKPKFYHVVYSDGDEEDVESDECVAMTHMLNDDLLATDRHISVCGILSHIFSSAAPAPKETVFTRAERTYGCDGPDVGHPFVGKYDIIKGVFDHHHSEDGVNNAKFTIRDPDDNTVFTSATLNRGPMLLHLQATDVLRLEVVSASLKHAFLRVSTCVGFVDVDLDDEATVTNMVSNKPIAVINIPVLGFFNKDTHKFERRPFAVEFLHHLSRHFHLATMSTTVGFTLRSKMFGAYSLMFCAEDGLDETLVDKPWIDSTNCLVIDDLRPDEEAVSSIQCDRMPRRLTISSHVK